MNCKTCKWLIGHNCYEPSSNIKKEVLEDDSCANYEMEKPGIEDEQLFNDIIKVLKKYLDIKEEYYPLIATWIIGTHIHKSFYSYPYLFFNAMKGSGKTRSLKLILELAYCGLLLGSISEASLFRTSNNTTFGIDEFESVGNKDKQALRELLNAAYKKGMLVPRVKEVRKQNPETGRSEKSFEVELCEVYRPIVMANIWGMDEVLADRSITLTLEKSSKKEITDMLEIFDLDEEIKDLKVRLIRFREKFSVVSVVSVDVVTKKDYTSTLKDWNAYLKATITTPNYITTLTPQDYTKLHLFNKIKESGISARALELSFPLIIIAEIFEKENEIISILQKIMNEKREDEIYESKDVQLFDFISGKSDCKDNFKSISELTAEFRLFMNHDNDEEIKWLNTKWMGRALKRLQLVLEKRRLGSGMDVKLDIEKANKRIKNYRSVDTQIEKEAIPT